jgi:hypothetical protein
MRLVDSEGKFSELMPPEEGPLRSVCWLGVSVEMAFFLQKCLYKVSPSVRPLLINIPSSNGSA